MQNENNLARRAPIIQMKIQNQKNQTSTRLYKKHYFNNNNYLIVRTLTLLTFNFVAMLCW